MPLLSGITIRKLAGFILRTRRWELDEYEYGRAFDASELVTVPAGGTYEFLFVNQATNTSNNSSDAKTVLRVIWYDDATQR